MKQQPNQTNVESFCGIVDVYDDEITSFSMKDPGTCHVKHRIDGDIAVSFDIEV